MSRKVYFAGSLFVALLTLVLSLALTWVATEAQAPATLAAVPAIGTQQDQNRVLGHARTDETTPRSVQNARIIATRVGVGEQVTALTDAMGAYTLTLPVGIATWSVAAEATESTIPAGAVAPNQPRLLVFGRGAETKAGIDFTFHIDTTNTASLQGHVMTPEDQPVAGVRVVAIKIDSLVSGGRLQVPTIRYTETGAQGEFAMMVDAGTWWVAVTLGADDPYMPYRLQWQTIVTVADGQTVDNMVLRVAPATARIHGALVREGSGEPATDACGIVAAFKQGEPAVYTYRTFTGASFDLPVTQGTYRVAVIPNPNLPVGSISLPAYLPSSSPTQIATCEAGKYLVRTLPQVTVEGPETDVVVPLRAAETTIHGRLWDLGSQQAVTGVQGLIFGWSPELSDSGGSGQGTWSAAPINPETGVGDLRAGSGDWLLAYQVDPNSSYHVAPGVITMTVPPGVPEIDVSLPVVGAESMVNGRVVAPDGSGVPGVLVVAAGISQLPGATGSLPGGGSIPASLVGDVAVVTDE
ncbi:MAG: carboxypeptidase regulatory-like domain-containing protein, partial [Chloroflexi bacterium]